MNYSTSTSSSGKQTDRTPILRSDARSMPRSQTKAAILAKRQGTKFIRDEIRHRTQVLKVPETAFGGYLQQNGI